MFENVQGLVFHDKGKTLSTILDLLAADVNGQARIEYGHESLGYHVHWKVLNSKDFGVPQNRRRIFIVGFRDPPSKPFKFPDGGRLADILEENVVEKYYLSDKLVQSLMQHLAEKQANGKKTRGGKRGVSTVDVLEPKTEDTTSYTLPHYRKGGGSAPQISKGFSPTLTGKMGTGGQNVPVVVQLVGDRDNRSVSVRDEANTVQANAQGKAQAVFEPKVVQLTGDRDSPGVSVREIANTIPANPMSDRQQAVAEPDTMNTIAGAFEKMIGCGRLRRLTPRECARLQGFPDSFVLPCSDTQSYRQMGNAVTVNVVEAVGRKMSGILFDQRERSQNSLVRTQIEVAVER